MVGLRWLPVLIPLAALGQSQAPSGHVTALAEQTLAFTNATIHLDAQRAIAQGVLLIRKGEVLTVGAKVDIPAGAVVRDLGGLHVWPALIEPYSDLGLPVSGSDERKRETHGARHWNGALRADAAAHELFIPDEEAASKLRQQGFALVVAHRMDGIARGSSAAVLLNQQPLPERVVAPAVAAHFSFRKGSSQDAYPSSLMGAVALVRQSWLDADWYATCPEPPETDAMLNALGCQLDGRIVVEASDRNDLLRWVRILHEFGRTGIIKGAGDEYARLAAIKEAGMPLIIPFAAPEAYDVGDPFDALEVSFARLKHWELAMRNPYLLDSVGVSFALTSHGRKDLKEFWKDARKLLSCGMDSSAVIAKLTSEPARLFGLEHRYGSLAPGMSASFIIASGHLLDEKNVIHETWVEGKRFLLEDADQLHLEGTYDLNLADGIWFIEVGGKPGNPEVSVRRPGEPDSLGVKARIEVNGEMVSLSFAPKASPRDITRLNGSIHGGGGVWHGQAQKPGGAWFAWSAVRKAEKRPMKAKADSAVTKESGVFGPVAYPLTGFGWLEAPLQRTVLIRNATVWTNAQAGIQRNTDVLIHEGKVKAVGADLDPNLIFPGKHKPEVAVVDGAGKHLTCGIVDEHSHIAIARGVNEGTYRITSEVRIGDVLNPDDVNIYRDLAGGVTTAQVLHGSANPIGGQSAIIKMRWGQSADSMLVRWARPRIKFALGENVKQSNWNVAERRFPQTRMGVEQTYYDGFHEAKRYLEEHARWALLKPKDREGRNPPRRDLRLEAVGEVLVGDRDISCHSYVQSEIAMLMHVADSMGFKVNTFTHVLEGYKVAPALERHGASASTFSDWWAYKFEVYDAIPYNAALLHRNGVNTGINSDDAEMSRRLNQEAAKTMKYGGLSAEEAWKMVTLNPARMLGLDHRIGSIEPGKDADLVLWNGDPLSIDSRVLRTYVDGVVYFDDAEDRARREWAATERDRIIRSMLQAKADGAPARRPRREQPHLWHCDDLEGNEMEGLDHDAH